MKVSYIVFLFVFHTSFSYNQILTLDVGNLPSDSLKTAFLEYVFDQDQHVRELSDAADLKYNEDRETYDKMNKLVETTDSINVGLIDAYIQLYGYSFDPNLSFKANYAPFTVIHHSSDLKFRLKYFALLKQAYLAGKLDEGSIIFYACRTIQCSGKKPKSACFDKDVKKLINKMEKLYDRYY